MTDGRPKLERAQKKKNKDKKNVRLSFTKNSLVYLNCQMVARGGSGMVMAEDT